MICQITVISQQTQFSASSAHITHIIELCTDHVYSLHAKSTRAHGPGVWSLQLTSERVPVGRMALSELARPRLTALPYLQSSYAR